MDALFVPTVAAVSGLRLDGIVLLFAIDAGVAIFFAVAVGAGIVALLRRAGGERARRIAARAALTCIGGGFIAVGAFTFVDKHGIWSGPDWIDWLAFPWALTVAAGCWMLFRTR